MNNGGDDIYLVHGQSLVFDPEKLYRIRARIRRLNGSGTISVGIAGRNANDDGWVNASGSNSLDNQFSFAADNKSVSTGYVIHTGYFKGRSGSSVDGGEHVLPDDPGVLQKNVRYFRPFIRHHVTGAGRLFVDAVIVDEIDDLAENAFNAAAQAQSTADGKIASFFQHNAPNASDADEGDIWFDTNDGNKIYRFNGNAWVEAKDSEIGQAVSKANAAQSAANAARAVADGKIVTFVRTSQPSSGQSSTGDLWYNPNTQQLRRYNGSNWNEIVATYNDGLLADKDTVDTPDIDDNAVSEPFYSRQTTARVMSLTQNLWQTIPGVSITTTIPSGARMNAWVLLNATTEIKDSTGYSIAVRVMENSSQKVVFNYLFGTNDFQTASRASIDFPAIAIGRITGSGANRTYTVQVKLTAPYASSVGGWRAPEKFTVRETTLLMERVSK